MIYFDSAATTKPCREAVSAAVSAAEVFGNPSSLHRVGLDAQKLVEESRRIISSKLGVGSGKIYFTSGGTESNNWAVFGAAHMLRKRGNHVITTKIEHPSVLESFKKLEEEGFRVTYLTPEKNGIVSEREIEKAVDEDTILVSMMYVNNETGAVQPIKAVKPILKEKAPAALFHCDCVQAFCKTDIFPEKIGADIVSISAHKIHGFKGSGAVYTANPRLFPIIFGGEQQNSLRPGTENVPGICAFGAAAAACDYDSERVRGLRTLLKEGLKKTVPDIQINGDEINSGNILNISFAGIRAEILLHALEKHEIYVSTGSACSTHKPQPSHVLTAMGLSKKEIEGAVRFSLDMDITEEDIAFAVGAIAREAAEIRRIIRN